MNQPQTLKNVEHRTPPQLNYVVDSPKRLQPSGLALPSSRNQRFAEPACVTFSNQMCDFFMCEAAHLSYRVAYF